ncbi:MAG: hypothetical protein PHY93_04110 [Bacteriovorax sp.]|nr:hypothetical protein [Bacteriovorax sp.]
MTNGNNDDDNRRDLTRIEDLSEFLHEEDSNVDNLFGSFETETSGHADMTTGISLDDLDSSQGEELPPELPESEEAEQEAEQNDEVSFFDESNELNELNDDLNFQYESESPIADFGDSLESASTQDSPFELSSDDTNDFSFANESNQSSEDLIADEALVYEDVTPYTPASLNEEAPSQEGFEEVKNFAQNFSYGQIQGGGNPPFSLVIRNLKYSEEAEDILIILREFGLVTDQNTPDTAKSLELGSLLVPQISEYSAIVLAHKLRRYDCDIEVGLSDEVHPSKSGDTNPRGLVKKNSLRQNIAESFKRDEDDTPVKEIIVSTTSALEGHVIKKYIGVQTSFAIVDEEELERLKFVQKTARMNIELLDYKTDESVTSERAFKDYQNSFNLLFTDLCDQLKVKAMKEKANALLGLNYQLTSLPFEKSAQGSICYQLTCSATLAVVRPEYK